MKTLIWEFKTGNRQFFCWWQYWENKTYGVIIWRFVFSCCHIPVVKTTVVPKRNQSEFVNIGCYKCTTFIMKSLQSAKWKWQEIGFHWSRTVIHSTGTHPIIVLLYNEYCYHRRYVGMLPWPTVFMLQITLILNAMVL